MECIILKKKTIEAKNIGWHREIPLQTDPLWVSQESRISFGWMEDNRESIMPQTEGEYVSQ